MAQGAVAVAGARNAGLDYLRTLSISIVLANHCFFVFFLGTGKAQWAGWPAHVSASAVIGIEWLFVLSGYLIGTMMIRSFEKPGAWFQRSRDFWLRRWFRTIPNYYLFLVVNAALAISGIATGSFDWTFLVFSQNLYLPETKPHFFGESWSLAMDEWFYLLMPLMLGLALWLGRMGTKGAFMVTAGLLIVGPMVARALHDVPHNFFVWDEEIRRITLYHLDATGWGVLAAAVNRWYKPWWERWRTAKAVLGLGLMVAGLAMVWDLVGHDWAPTTGNRVMNMVSLTLMDMGSFLMMPWLTHLRIGKGVFDGFVERTSLYSYSIYLCHFPMLFLVKHVSGVSGDTRAEIMAVVVIAWLALVYALSALVFHRFEKPVSDLRERYTRRVSSLPF